MKKQLFDIIDYEKDIEPHQFIQILSGVGSGKNYLINQLIAGYTATRSDGTTYQVKPHRILTITSRRAKADEASKEKSISIGTRIDEWINGLSIDDGDQLEEYLRSTVNLPTLDNGWGEAPVLHQRSIVCTNAAIEQFISNKYIPNEVTSHLWQRFDLIVLDEVHSVMADASYQSAPFYAQKLINEVYQRNKNRETSCKVIIMTGTPEILQDYRIPKDGYTIDVMDECHKVTPKSITFMTQTQAKEDLMARFQANEKLIYFSNHIKPLFSLHHEFPEEQQCKIALDFSQEDRIDENDPEHLRILEKKKTVKKHLTDNQKLPDDIQIFATTSRNKEGINIGNKDIKTMYVEAHADVDVIQMAGRVRDGLDRLIIVTDASGFPDRESHYEYELTCNERLHEKINHFFASLCQKNNISLDDCTRKNINKYPALEKFIQYIHAKFPYILFNYFNEKFELYSQRHSSKKYYKQQEEIFKEAVNSRERLERLAKTWFPDIEVYWEPTTEEKIIAYLNNNQLINRPLSNEEVSIIKKNLQEITGENFSSLNPILEPCGYHIDKASGNKIDGEYKKKITPWPKQQ